MFQLSQHLRMFGSHVFFVFWGISSVGIFGESNDGETNLLGVASHEDLTDPYSILQCNETHRDIMNCNPA